MEYDFNGKQRGSTCFFAFYVYHCPDQNRFSMNNTVLLCP